jgi:hypothetical protein
VTCGRQSNRASGRCDERPAGATQLKNFSGEAHFSGGKPAGQEGKSREGAQVELSSCSGDIHIERQ